MEKKDPALVKIYKDNGLVSATPEVSGYFRGCVV
jgi:hypothetical protein